MTVTDCHSYTLFSGSSSWFLLACSVEDEGRSHFGFPTIIAIKVEFLQLGIACFL